MTKRTPTKVRKEEILSAALDIAKTSGLAAVSGKKIAAALGIGRTGIMHHIISMHELRCAVMRRAIKTEELVIIAQGLAAGDPIAQEAPEGLRRRAADMLVG